MYACMSHVMCMRTLMRRVMHVWIAACACHNTSCKVCVAVRCSVCCSVCCNVLQCVAVCLAVCVAVCVILQCMSYESRHVLVITRHAKCVLQCVVVCVAVCAAVCCSVLQCVAVCVAVCVILQCMSYESRHVHVITRHAKCVLQFAVVCVAVCAAVCCSVLQCVLQCVSYFSVCRMNRVMRTLYFTHPSAWHALSISSS